MSVRLTPAWQRRRGELNHDRLKNEFLPALAKCLNLLDGHIEDVEFERTFAASTLSHWCQLRDEAVCLAKSFETEMSPCQMLDFGPLARCDEETRIALGKLVHSLWIARYAVRQRVTEVLNQVELADELYQQLNGVLAKYPEPPSTSALLPVRGQLSEYWHRCRDLAGAIEAFPSEVKVT